MLTAMETYVVDGDGWSRDEVVSVCRSVLTAVQGRAVEFECDVPGDPGNRSDTGDWPEDVRAAARVLRSLPSARIERGGYGQTGVVEGASGRVREAFVTFAPWAFDASVWSADAGAPVRLADEGTSLVVELEPSEREVIAGIVGVDRLVPLREWRRRHRWFRRGR
ncbi:hypothetical protein OG394_34515 [Kribbella sp. NBC_01245]|uniref:hypothetical protein n=1 Tax=Kribbella sp. NBC_01245 TaxID=2903578 RepID=UPI002E2C9439|nr:hypothetical protein [Kribbella sp. NBC_01245]